jgi:hypothetical protein
VVGWAGPTEEVPLILAFLESSAGADNPLVPITPMRLAFLIRNALVDVAPASESDGAVYAEMWVRRHELAERAETALGAYRVAMVESSGERRVWSFIGGAAGIIESAATLTFVVAGTMTNQYFDGARDGSRPRRRDDDIAWALEALDRIGGTRSRQRAGKLGMSRWGMSAERSAQTTWTEREPSRADWIAEFRGYVKGHRLRRGAPILVAIDELDKVADADQAIDLINDIKDLFHIEGVHFVVSISDDALDRFATRGIPVRDAFDTAFDAVVEVRRLTADESYELLRQRARHFPYPAALFCHAWSGGLPRDLVRTARACIVVQNRGKRPVPIAEAAHAIIRRDVTEVLDAAIRRQNPDGPIEALLALRRLIEDEPPHLRLADRDLPSAAGDPLLPSLEVYLDVAVAVSEYYSVTRDSEQWNAGIKSGEFLRHADLFAEARAALAVHPHEAAWRLDRARREVW